MGTVTRLSNKKRLALIMERTMREAKKRDPHCIVYSTTALSEEIFRQLTTKRRKRKK